MPTVVILDHATRPYSPSWSSQMTASQPFDPFGAGFELLWYHAYHECYFILFARPFGLRISWCLWCPLRMARAVLSCYGLWTQRPQQPRKPRRQLGFPSAHSTFHWSYGDRKLVKTQKTRGFLGYWAALYDKICMDKSHVRLGISATRQVWV